MSNLLERDIRILATGRKSWLFSDTVDGAKVSTVVYSIMLTCRACAVEPLPYLRQVLTELPQCAENNDISDLLPFNFPSELARSKSLASICREMSVYGQSRCMLLRDAASNRTDGVTKTQQPPTKLGRFIEYRRISI